MKRSSTDSEVDQSSVKRKQSKTWTDEQDQFLRKETERVEIINWRNICKRFNKEFKPIRRTMKECEGRWKELAFVLTFNEELLILLMFYKGQVDLAKTLFESKINIEIYLKKLLQELKEKSYEIALGKFSYLCELQFILCVDLSFNPSEYLKDELEEFRDGRKDWLEVAQIAARRIDKLNEKKLHEVAKHIVEDLEKGLCLIVESNINDLKDIMHERKDNPSQMNPGFNLDSINPILRLNLNFFPNYYRQYESNN